MERDRLDGVGDAGVPAEVARELRGLYSGRVVVEPRVDEAVLAAASRRAAAGRARKRLRLRMGAWGLAAAAGLAVGAVVWTWGGGVKSTGQPQGGLTSGTGTGVGGNRLALDVNRDGVVDIVDALVLERVVEGKATAAAGDLDGDGAVDRRDVDRVAMAAVSLGKGG